jgi:type I restriction-modification system DNA methylase subunit
VASADASRDHGVLFARAYLDSKLAKLKEDQQTYLVETLKEWFDKTDSSSLKALVASFVGPVLDVLGHIRSELGENSLTLYSDRSRQKAVSLCYVVSPHESLDQTSKGRNYAVSLIIALRNIGLKWGILTNGLLWRLYCVKEKAPFETYFQVDLGEALQTRDSKETFLLAEFFGATAFLPSETSRCRLDVSRHESDEETREIEKHLESKIESILSKICMGFIESEGKKSYTEVEKRTVFNNSIYLLYRILFILYAEARGLLPLQNPEYYEKSLENLMSSAKENHFKGMADQNSKAMWNNLCELFDWINHGNRTLGILPYNGGLFDDSEKPYLANHVIHDAYLSEAIFSLGFRVERSNIVKINYNDLSVRHLGGLYEGILEYQLFIATERLVRRKEKDVYKFLPESAAGKITRADIVIEKGNIYFSQSSEERRLTGSYYTPEDVVEYIVENSLGRHLIAISKELQSLADKLMDARATAIDDKEKKRIERFIDAESLSFLEKKVLSTRILDPAMGSGHFLVNAAYYLANYIVESLCFCQWENYSIDTSPLSWRRRVVEKCIFGVDLNDLATELAKLSLWLITADNKRPLTFLDHHLRTGNSLLGSDLDQLVALPNNKEKGRDENIQIALDYPIFQKEFIPRVLQAFGEMETASEKIEDIERKKGKYREWEKLKKDLQGVADTWLSTFFGYHIEESKYQSLLNEAMEEKEILVDEKVRDIAFASENRFFHWWLEFPEIFFRVSSEEDRGNGFDVVIGNPPYGKMQVDKARSIRQYLSNENAYTFFVEKGLKITKDSGFFSFVIPVSWQTGERYAEIRRFLLNTYKLVLQLNLPFDVFKEAYQDTGISVFQNEKPTDDSKVLVFQCPSRFPIEMIHNTQLEAIKYSAIRKDADYRLYTSRRIYQLREKLSGSEVVSLGDITKSTIGILASSYDMSNDMKDDIWIPFLVGNVYRYSVDFKEFKFVNFAKHLNSKYMDFYLLPRLLVRRIVSRQNRLMATMETRPYVSKKDIYCFVVTDVKYDLLYVLANLNSCLHSYYYISQSTIASKDDFRQTTLGELRALPIKYADPETQEEFSKLAAMILECRKKIATANSDEVNLTKLEQEIDTADARIDSLIFKLYNFNEEEVNAVLDSLQVQFSYKQKVLELFKQT